MSTIKAMDLAVEQANEIESIGERKIAILHCDILDDTTGEIDGETGETVVKNVTRYLVDELQVKAIIGPSTSTNSSWAYDIAKTGSVLISPSATSIGLSVIDGEIKQMTIQVFFGERLVLMMFNRWFCPIISISRKKRIFGLYTKTIHMELLLKML